MTADGLWRSRPGVFPVALRTRRASAIFARMIRISSTIATSGNSPIPTAMTSAATRAAIWVSASGSTPVSAMRWRRETRIACEEILARVPDYVVKEAGLERMHSPSVRGFSRMPVRAAL